VGVERWVFINSPPPPKPFKNMTTPVQEGKSCSLKQGTKKKKVKPTVHKIGAKSGGRGPPGLDGGVQW